MKSVVFSGLLVVSGFETCVMGMLVEFKETSEVIWRFSE